MAQLIKLQDYVSRYESDMYRYPGQFIRLKRNNWEKLKKTWEYQKVQDSLPTAQEKVEDEDQSSWKKYFKKSTGSESTQESSPSFVKKLPESMDDLEQLFLDRIFTFQLTWAATTLRRKSFMNASYRHNPHLKFFLQRFPDTFLIMYEPIVRIKEAPLDTDIIIITPVGVEIIHCLDVPPGVTVHPEDDKTWMVEQKGQFKKVISPLISLNRSETYVKSVLSKYNLDIPYKKIVLGSRVDIKGSTEPYKTAFIGRERYLDWFKEMRTLNSPLKHIQLKTAEALTKHSVTTSIRRTEWEQEEEISME